MTPKIVDRDSKREEIIQAAIRAFLENGVQGATIQDIARQARMGKGTIYEYFESKEDIFHSTFEYFVGQMDVVFRRTMKGAADPVEKLRRIIFFLPSFLSGETSLTMNLIFDFWAMAIHEPSTRTKLMDTMKRFYQGYNDMVSSIILEGMSDGSFKRDLNPDKVASIITGALDGMLVQWVLDRDSMDFAATMDQFFRLLFQGIQAEP